MMNVISKTCCQEGCKKIPIYNVEGKTKGLYCSIHKKEGMINVKRKTCCQEGCKTQPTYNVEGKTKGLYCSIHKKEGMINVINKTCKSEWRLTTVRDKYDGYCLFCFMNLFPDKPVSRNYKTKEYAVVEYIVSEFTDVEWIADK